MDIDEDDFSARQKAIEIDFQNENLIARDKRTGILLKNNRPSRKLFFFVKAMYWPRLHT
jgi:hypothetical protein